MVIGAFPRLFIVQDTLMGVEKMESTEKIVWNKKKDEQNPSSGSRVMEILSFGAFGPFRCPPRGPRVAPAWPQVPPQAPHLVLNAIFREQSLLMSGGVPLEIGKSRALKFCPATGC